VTRRRGRGRELPTRPCACCGQLTIKQDHDICRECYWQSDAVDEANPDDVIGPNRISLNQARLEYERGK